MVAFSYVAAFTAPSQNREAAIDTLAGCSALDGAAVRRLWDSYRSQPGAIHWSRPLALVVLGNSLRP